MDMESNLNFRGARVVKAVAYAAHVEGTTDGTPVQLRLKSLMRDSHLIVWMSYKEARQLAAQLSIMGEKGDL